MHFFFPLRVFPYSIWTSIRVWRHNNLWQGDLYFSTLHEELSWFNFIIIIIIGLALTSFVYWPVVPLLGQWVVSPYLPSQVHSWFFRSAGSLFFLFFSPKLKSSKWWSELGVHVLFFVQSIPQILFSNHFPGIKPLLLQICSALLNNQFGCTILLDLFPNYLFSGLVYSYPLFCTDWMFSHCSPPRWCEL